MQAENKNIKVQMFACSYVQFKIAISFLLERFIHYTIFFFLKISFLSLDYLQAIFAQKFPL